MKKTLLRIAVTAAAILLTIYLLLKFIPYNDLEMFLNKPYSIRLCDREGRILTTLPLNDGSRRKYLNIKETPGFIKKMFINSEDKRFYFHFGVDPLALTRSIYLNFKYKKNVSGASTITMQLARIISPHEPGMKGKITEAFNALRIEARLSKKKILELWLNSIPYGYRATGILTAGKVFFGKEISLLTTGELLALAVIPRSPEKYNPFDGKEQLINKIYDLSGRINLKLTHAEIEKDLMNRPEYDWVNNAVHFTNYIKSRMSHKDFASGMPVQTSLDLSLNEKLEERIRYFLKKNSSYRVSNGALFAIDNRTGEIICYIGSNDFYDRENSGEIDGIQNINQPGSTLKPFLYALALENGFTPAAILPDIPMDFGDENLYFPLNFNRRFNGPVRLRTALASSLNVPAVYLVTKLGVQKFIDKLLELEFDSLLNQRDRLGSGIALGNAEISVYELTRAFSIFPRGGETNMLSFKKEKDKKFKYGKRVFSKYTSLMICDILSDNSSRLLGFGPNSALNVNYPAMFKTGTSNQFNNVWSLGATVNFTVGVWIGNFSGETVIGQMGNSLPAFICVEALNLLNKKEPSADFPKPDNAEEINICSLSGEKSTGCCISSVKEYIKKGTTLKECQYHTLKDGRVVTNYPAMYSGWLAKKNRENAVFRDDSAESYPKIMRPNDKSIFYIDPGIPLKNQAIRIEIINDNSSEELTVYINGKPDRKIKYPYKYFFQLVKGVHKIDVAGIKGKDSIELTVN